MLKYKIYTIMGQLVIILKQTVSRYLFHVKMFLELNKQSADVCGVA